LRASAPVASLKFSNSLVAAASLPGCNGRAGALASGRGRLGVLVPFVPTAEEAAETEVDLEREGG